MKRCRQTSLQNSITRQSHRCRSGSRRGTLFNYYLVYLMLTGSIMAAAGLCMHAALRSDQADTSSSWQLQALRNMERQFRLDIGEAESVQLIDSQLVCIPGSPVAGEFSEVAWTADGAVVRRVVRAGDTETQRQRFVFADGTSTSFHIRDERRVVVLLQEPGSHRVEILAYVTRGDLRDQTTLRPPTKHTMAIRVVEAEADRIMP